MDNRAQGFHSRKDTVPTEMQHFLQATASWQTPQTGYVFPNHNQVRHVFVHERKYGVNIMRSVGFKTFELLTLSNIHQTLSKVVHPNYILFQFTHLDFWLN